MRYSMTLLSRAMRYPARSEPKSKSITLGRVDDVFERLSTHWLGEHDIHVLPVPTGGSKSAKPSSRVFCRGDGRGPTAARHSM